MEETMAKTFISEHLAKHLREDPELEHNLSKKVVWNLYYRWCKAKGHETKVM
jgi:hypothetical protein